MKSLRFYFLILMGLFTTHDANAVTYSGIEIYRVDSGAFDKPVIIVEGYDAENEISARDIYDTVPQQLKDYLKYSGRDIITVSFTDTTKSLITNANNLINFITWVNQNKSGSHPNAIMGISMGGVVTRYALKKMENTGKQHNTSLYISYDSPHRGLYVPGDILSALKHMKKKLEKYVPKPLRNAGVKALNASIRKLDSAAAREMFVTQPQSTSFYANLDNLGYPDDLVRVAYAMGDRYAQRTGINENINTSLLRYKIRYYQIQTYNYNIRVGNCYLPCDRLNGHYASHAASTKDSIWQMDNDLNSSSPFGLIWDYDRSEANFAQHGLIPTFSALDLKHWDLDTQYSEAIKAYSPFDFIYVNAGNMHHDDIGITIDVQRNWANIVDNIDNYHVPSPYIPSRDNKIAPLASLSSAYGEWVIRGRNYLNWSAVTGATHYEIYDRYLNLINTTTALHSMIDVYKNGYVQIRACDNMTCSYPKSIYVAFRNDNPY